VDTYFKKSGGYSNLLKPGGSLYQHSSDHAVSNTQKN